MAESANPWAAAPGAWVTLATLLETVARELGIPGDRAAEVLRLPLEKYEILTAVFDSPRRANLDQAKTKHWVAEGHPGTPSRYCVSQRGWEHVDWTTGTLAGCEIKVCWPHVVRELAFVAREYRKEVARQSVEAVETNNGPAADSDGRIVESIAWMRGYALACKDATNKPKRDGTLKLCQDELGVTYRVALAGWNALPDAWKNPPRTAKT